MSNNEEISLFGPNNTTEIFTHQLNIEKFTEQLIKFGLTTNQCKVFIYLGKYGIQTALNVSKTLGIPRTETYHLLNHLQGLGLVVAHIHKPTKYSVLSIKEALSILIKKEQNRLDDLTDTKQSLTSLWAKIPQYAISTNKSDTEKFQLLQGAAPIKTKLLEMANTSSTEFKVFGSLSDVNRFFHDDIFDSLHLAPGELKIIMSPTENSPEFLSEFDKNTIRTLKTNSNLVCFIINDQKEILLFIRNTNHESRQTFAWWTNSDTLIDMMQIFFDMSWENSEKYY